MNDCALALMGDSQEEDRKRIADLTLAHMEESSTLLQVSSTPAHQHTCTLGCKVDFESFEALDITIACNSLPELKVKVNLGVKVEFTQHMSDAQYDLRNWCLYI